VKAKQADLPESCCFGLMRRRQCRVLTWKGWLLVLLLVATLAVAFVRGIYPFLALNKPQPGEILVVEGWASDEVLQMAVVEFKSHGYQKLLVTGGPLEQGGPLSEYKTYAQLGAAILLKLGLTTNELAAVPAPLVIKDRTYASAVSLNKWLGEHGMTPRQINLITVGPHARRSRLLFQKAFGRGAVVGVVSAPVGNFDPAHWWRSSQGFRTVTGEIMAYIYARFLFHEPSS
jgi:uncharacterized SAM-binding protein YcdF (DUF218 family)